MTIQFTQFTAPPGHLLTKEYRLEDGQLRKRSAAQLYRGIAQTIEVEGLFDLQPFFEALQRHQALATGVADVPEAAITTLAKLTPQLRAQGYRTRTLDTFRQPGTGLLLLDHDQTPYMPEGFRCAHPAQLVERLTAVPGFQDLTYFGTESSSAGISIEGTGKVLAGHGLHVYLVGRNVDPAALRRWLQVHLWRAGLGYIEHAADGTPLVKYIVDLTVLSSERLIFEARPYLHPGLSQRPRRYQWSAGEMLQGTFAVTAEDWAAHERAVAAAKEAPVVLARAADFAAAHRERQAGLLVARTGMSLEDARRRTRRAVLQVTAEGIELPGDYVIDMGSWYCTAHELLGFGAEYDGRAIPDPIEGRAYGRGTAKFYWNNGFPRIHSFAHGGKTLYRLPQFATAGETEVIDPAD